jgi:hypothetical protein
MLERDLLPSFQHLSVSDTILRCLLLGQHQWAAKIKSDLRVSERRYAWLELKAIIQTEQWDSFDKVPLFVVSSHGNTQCMYVADNRFLFCP